MSMDEMRIPLIWRKRPWGGYAVAGVLVCVLAGVAARAYYQMRMPVMLMDAARRADITTVRSLLAQGADPNIRLVVNGPTPMSYAIIAGSSDMANVLLQHGARADAQAFIYALQLHRPQIARALLSHGFRLSVTENAGSNLLANEASNGDLPAMQVLVEGGANVNAGLATWHGYTPLMCAAREGREACVVYLLRQGADPNKRASDGSTALSLASRRGHENIVRLLRAAGAKQ